MSFGQIRENVFVRKGLICQKNLMHQIDLMVYGPAASIFSVLRKFENLFSARTLKIWQESIDTFNKNKI